MRAGVYVKNNRERIEKIKSLGYDYVEMPLNLVTTLGGDELEQLRSMLSDNDIVPECFCGFFKTDTPIVGENVDFDYIAEYSKSALEKAESLGGKVAVIGSGKSRRVPEGFERARAEEQLIRVLDTCGDIAKKHGIKIVLEPLNRNETDLINTVEQCKQLITRCSSDNVGALVDFFHIFMSGESLDAVSDRKNPVWHAHIARADIDRAAPLLGRDDLQTAAFADALKNSGYDGRITLECIYTDFEKDIANAKKVFDKYYR